MNDIKIAMCDDVEQLCLNIRDFCKYSDGIEFVGYCNNVSECIDMLKKSKPDILLLDIQIETEDAGIKMRTADIFLKPLCPALPTISSKPVPWRK